MFDRGATMMWPVQLTISAICKPSAVPSAKCRRSDLPMFINPRMLSGSPVLSSMTADNAVRMVLEPTLAWAHAALAAAPNNLGPSSEAEVAARGPPTAGDMRLLEPP